MEANELVQSESPEVMIAPDEEVVVEEKASEETVEETPVEAVDSEETEDETPEEPKKVDAAPEVDPDSKLAAALERLEKMEKRLGFEQRQREKIEKQLSRNKQLPEIKDEAAPSQDDFEDYEQYQEAKIAFEVQRGIAQYQQKISASEKEGNLESFISETTNAGREMYDDFDSVVLQNHVPITKPMLQIMQESDNPESVAYYLGKNIKEATAISRMSPVQASRALALIEAKVGNELQVNPTGKPFVSAQPKKIISNAPSPVKPTGSANIITKDPEKMNQREYEAWRAKGGGR